jgi:membrane fusion protein, adhesin transport system
VLKISKVVWICAAAFASLFAWASLASLDEVVRGVGQVTSRTPTQVIQNLEGGIISSLLVAEGDLVNDGQTVARIDATLYESEFEELQGQRTALSLRIARLAAEANLAGSFTPPSDLAEAAPDIAKAELSLFNGRRKLLNSRVHHLQKALELRTEEVKILQPMVNEQAVPRIDLLRSELAATEVSELISATVDSFESERSLEYSESLGELRRVLQQLRVKKDQLDRSIVKSPVRGVINRILATTQGGVVSPGEPIIEVIPLDSGLKVIGRVSPSDIGFVYVGMPAQVKLTAFDFSIYGSLDGVLHYVSADTVVDETQREAQPYYEVHIELTGTELVGPAGTVEIRPGMQAELELKSGSRTVLSYLLKPLIKASGAFGER